MDKSNLPDNINELFVRIQELLRKTELCQYLINNYNVLSDEYLIAGLRELAPNILTEEDYYKIISIHDGKKYKNRPIPIHLNKKNFERRRLMLSDNPYFGPLDIRTTLYEPVLCEEGVKNMGVILTVLHIGTTNPIVFYDKDRIQELLDKKKIVILNKSYNPDGAPYIGRPPEECPQYELAMGDVDHKEFFSSEGKYYETTNSYIKSAIDCDALSKFLDYLLVLVANEMDRASFLQRQFREKGFQKRIKDLRRK